MLFLDTPRLVLPKGISDKHRGDYFEKYIAEQWQTLTGDSFFFEPVRTLKVRDSAAQVFFNATDAISGQFMAFGNERPPLPPGAQPGANRLNLALFDAKELADLRIAQAVHFSARFLYLSPALDVELPAATAAQALFGRQDIGGTKKTRVATLVDGGYFDNSGLGPRFACWKTSSEMRTRSHAASSCTSRTLRIERARPILKTRRAWH